MNRMMKKQTQAIHTQFQRRDAYNSLSMPVYHTAAYEFDNADDMADAFCGRTDAPDYSRVMNPTVTFFENKVKELTGAAEIIALNSGMAAISNTLFSIAAAGVWEIWEFSTDMLFGFHSQNNSLIDTMMDIICGSIMGIITNIPIYLYIKGKNISFIENIVKEMNR